MLFGYARVSTLGQTLEEQVAALTAAGAETIFQEKISGARGHRPQMAKLLATIRQGDEVICTRITRFGRNLRDMLNNINTVMESGAQFRSIREPGADTRTTQGRLYINLLGAFAEFDREYLLERTNEGRAAAMARGKKMGRKLKLTPSQQSEALSDLSAGHVTQADLARRYNVSRNTISLMVKRNAI